MVFFQLFSCTIRKKCLLLQKYKKENYNHDIYKTSQ